MRLSLSCRLFALAAIAFAPAAALAAKEGDGHDHAKKPALLVDDHGKVRPATEAEIKAAAGGGHAEPGPLDFTGIKRYDLGIYTLIVFGLLVFLLTKFAWPSIKEGLEKREANIRSALDEARRDREQSVAAMVEARKQLDAAALNAKEVLDEARRDADALKATEREAGVKDAASERERARREVETLKDTMVKEVYEQAVRLAALMAEKALRRSVAIEDHARLLDESIAELKDSANKA